ncbi:solute carrier family 22 member 21, partial [Biomphalaria pfeifferi]
MFFKNKNLFKVTAITSFLLLVDVFAYEGLIMISPELSPDFYLGFTLAALTDFPAAVLFILLINRIGRKRSIGLFHLLAGTLLLMSTLLLHTSLSDRIPGNFWISVVLSLLGRLTLSAGYSSVLLYVPELFPTSIRNTGYALALLMSYFASMVSPYSRSLSKLFPWAPNVVFGVMCVTVPLAIRRLPETMNKELSQTLADMERNMRKAMKKAEYCDSSIVLSRGSVKMDQGEVIDNVFIALKWNGFYQVSRTAILLLSLVNNAFTAASVVFIGKAVNFNCRRLKSLSVKNVTYDLSLSNSKVPFLINYTECSVDVRNGSDLIFTSNCSDGYEYADSMTSSFVAEWDLVCDKESYSDISQGVVVLGEMFGCLSLTRFADRCGRKVTYIITSVMYFAANMLAAFSISFAYFLVFRFITGVFDACCQQLSYIMLIEMMPTTHRALPQKLSSFIWPISLIFLCLVAYLTRDLSWHFTHICLSMFAIHSIFLW